MSLGEMLEHGEGVVKNMQRACNYYTMAAKRMSQLAQWNAGLLLESRRYCFQNISQAVHYFRLCANSGRYEEGFLCAAMVLRSHVSRIRKIW